MINPGKQIEPRIILFGLMYELGNDGLRNILRNKLGNELRVELYSELWNELGARIWHELWDNYND